MKVFSSTYDLEYSWDEVSAANWRKYCPWNKESTHVIAVDTLSRRLDQDTGILRTERLITCKQSTPKWISSFMGNSDVSYVYEVSYVQPSTSSSEAPSEQTLYRPALQPPQQPTVTMTSTNMTWSDLLNVRETVVYKPSPLDPAAKTRFEQEARITAMCGGWQRVREKIEGFTAERFGQNAAKGRKGFEEVLEMSRAVFREQRERETM